MSRHPTDHPTGYARPEQMWAAVTAHIKNVSPTAISELQRQFLYDRFLARVFTHDPTAWVLKGGTALLTRVRDARHSRDVDLNCTAGTLEDAVQELHAAATTNLEDHVRFTTAPTHRMHPPPPGQPGQVNARLQITPHIGVRAVQPFGIDVVVGTLLTADPDIHHATPVVVIPGITSPPYRLYSVVDHVADKVCATMELHDGQPSSRHRDLVDLVIIACTQTVSAAPLTHAIEAERLHRGLPPISAWTSPLQWSSPYAKAARAVAHCAKYPTYADATALIARFLDPVLSSELIDGIWNPQTVQWNPPHP